MSLFAFKPRATHHASHFTAFGMHAAPGVTARWNEAGFCPATRSAGDLWFRAHSLYLGAPLNASDPTLQLVDLHSHFPDDMRSRKMCLAVVFVMHTGERLACVPSGPGAECPMSWPFAMAAMVTAVTVSVVSFSCFGIHKLIFLH